MQEAAEFAAGRLTMFFNIDGDSGDTINGWLAPDNPSVTPKLLIVVPGRPDLVLDANVSRPDISDLGLHSSGRVGFSITDSVLPGLAELSDLEIQEAESRIPIYRRFIAERHLNRKLFLFDASVMPQRAIQKALADHFALFYNNSERFPLETMIVLIANTFSKSLCFCGRPNLSRYSTFLESGEYFRAALLREPVEELSERLLFLKLLSKSTAPHHIETFASGLQPLMDFVQRAPLEDPKQLLNAFRQIDDAQRHALTSPMVRMFACGIDENPTHDHVSLALERLATLDAVGTRAKFANFRTLLQRLIDPKVLSGVQCVSYPSVAALADTLQQSGIVLDLLEHDLALYAHVEQALTTGWSRAAGTDAP